MYLLIKILIFYSFLCDTSSQVVEDAAGSKKGWARGRGKLRGRALTYNGHGVLAPSPQAGNTITVQYEIMAKPMSKGPRMPDGTRGFTMGRGKPIPSQNSSQSTD